MVVDAIEDVSKVGQRVEIVQLGDLDDGHRARQGFRSGTVSVVGNRFNGESNDIVVVRYTADGSFDAGFGVGEDDGTPDGVVNISLGDGNDFGTAIATQADADYARNGPSNGVGQGLGQTLVGAFRLAEHAFREFNEDRQAGFPIPDFVDPDRSRYAGVPTLGARSNQ